MHAAEPTTLADDLALTALGDGRFGATITRRWWIVIGPNGGLLAALLLRAGVAAAERPDLWPRSLTVHYLSAPEEGPVELDTAVERSGRRAAFVAVTMRQHGKVITQGRTVLVAAQDPAFDADYGVAMPEVPAASDSPTVVPARGRYHDSFFRFDRRDALPAPEHPTTEPIAGWLRLQPPQPIDAAVLALMCDNWPPSARSLLADPYIHSTTLQLSVYFRAADPALRPEEHCLVVLTPRGTAEGIHQEDAEVWSPDGRILATSRQVALVFRADDSDTPHG